jgi:hypothetical protein
LPTLDPGHEVVLCVQQTAGKQMVALKYFGAFEVRSDELFPLARKEGFASEVRQVPPALMISSLVARAETVNKVRLP